MRGRATVSWPGRPVEVRVPATSANLGPGFDALGLALALHDVVTAQVTSGGLAIEVSGEGAEGAPVGERHLVVRAMRAAIDRPGVQPPAIRRRRVSAFQGGGRVIAWTSGWGARFTRLAAVAGLTPVICIPDAALATHAARQALPAAVPHADAAANAARAALLVTALTSDPDLLLDATEDFLHQPYRAAAMPGTASLVGRLRAAGVPAVVSGAGPAVLGLTVAGRHPGPAALARIASVLDPSWQVRTLQVDRGARARWRLP